MMIGQLSKISGVGIETIRFYERRGLLLPANRKASGYRQYDMQAVARINFIKSAKELGFTLDDIKDLLSLRIDKASECLQIKIKAQNKLQETRRKMSELKKIESVLERLVDTCDERSPTSECPILDCLEGEKNE